MNLSSKLRVTRMRVFSQPLMMTPLKALQEEFRYDPHIPEKPFVVQKINGLEGFRLDKQVPPAYKKWTTQRVGVGYP